MNIQLNINGLLVDVIIRPDEYLVETLRKLDYKSVKKGCDTTSCGVCTILIDDKPVPSCSYLSAKAEGHRITTIEGIAQEAKIIANLIGKEGADQCGFCNPGFALTAYAMKLEGHDYSSDDIRHYLVGNLCRCSGYVGQQNALEQYLEVK